MRPEPRRLRVGVLSDLHATSQTGDDAGSWLTTTTPVDPTQHPLRGLWPIIEGETIDLLLCAGDITNQADPAALVWAWRELNDAAARSPARLIATTGNHDLDSQHNLDLDPKGALYDLDPPFPAGTEALRDSYWARNYAIIADPNDARWRVVTMNSSAFHGYSKGDQPELHHGRISSQTTKRLERDLKDLPEVGVQILLLHHHLEPLPVLQPDGHSQLREAQPLLDMLERTGPWIVIHGHQHQPHIMYAHGGGSVPVIFSSGSLAAHAFGQLSSSAGKNQFYVLEFAGRDELDALDLGIAVQFHTWNWRPEVGWERASASDLLPGTGGLGWRVSNLRGLAGRIAKMVRDAGGRLPIADFTSDKPQFQYMAPSDLQRLLATLDNKHNIGVTRGADGALDTFASKMEPVGQVEGEDE